MRSCSLTDSPGLSCPVQTSLEQKETKATKSETELARYLFCASRIEIYGTSDVRVARMLSARENSSHVDYVWRLSNVSGVKRITILFPSRILCSLRFLLFHDEATELARHLF